jgi:putative ABC transport system ATP-binding protein
MIALQDIHVTFKRRTPLENKVLRGLNLTLQTGEFVTVIGGNGAGKSTLLNVICGDTPVDHGRISLDGLCVTHQSPEERAGAVARVFQDPMLGTCSTLTVEENLALAMRRGKRRTLGWAVSASLRADFQQALAHLGIGLEKRLKDPMGTLSGGQRQAVSLIMATLQPSKILLLDEHTAALDPKMARLVMNLTAQLVRERQLTTLMITHSMQQALHFGSRTLIMRHGRIAKDFQGSERQNLSPQTLLQYFEA